MKLPLFHIQKRFKDLFEEMGAEYSKNEVNVWTYQGDSILERIIKDGEVLIEEGDIANYIDDDGFFRVEGKLVLVYIRDQYLRRNPYNDDYNTEITEEYINEHQGYRYHLIQCQTIRKAISDQRRNRYVLRSPSYKGEKGDNTFKINSNGCVLNWSLAFSYALSIVTEANVNNIYLAGFDGYYKHDHRQIEMNDILNKYSKLDGKKMIKSITKSTYNII